MAASDLPSPCSGQVLGSCKEAAASAGLDAAEGHQREQRSCQAQCLQAETAPQCAGWIRLGARQACGTQEIT